MLPLSLAKHTWCRTSRKHLPCLAESSSITYCALLHILRVGQFGISDGERSSPYAADFEASCAAQADSMIWWSVQ